jgi:alkylation response protein AidB-like acyl-CoA dehydrogenase
VSLYGPEHDELRASVRKLLGRAADSPAVRATIAGPEPFDRALWSRLAGELGLTGLAVAERYGGSGYGVTELAVVLEEIGRASLPGPYLVTTLASLALALAHPDDHTAALLRGIAGGEQVVAVHVGSRDIAPDGAVTVRYVPDATAATHLLVAGPDGGAVVGLNDPGVTVTALAGIDLTRGLGHVSFPAGAARSLDVPGDWAGRVGALAVVLLACEQVGGAERVLEMSVDYARTRVQFGRPIGSFQAVAHTLADMLTELELARSVQQHAVRLAANGAPLAELAPAASAAKIACSAMFEQLTSETIRVHGGIGFTWEHDAHLYFRRARTSAVLFGDVGWHADQVADVELSTQSGAIQDGGADPVADRGRTGADEPEVAAFHSEVTAWFAAHGTRKRPGLHRAGDLGVRIRDARAYQRDLADAGLAGLNWPAEYGGRALGRDYLDAFAAAARGYETFGDVFTIGLGMCAPVLLALGSAGQRDRYLRPMLRGEELWCQLFSEPEAGSDLASLITAAERDGDGWVISGQKLWTTFAQYCDFGLLLARTDQAAPRHQGITMFVTDMRAPGVSVRPLRQVTGDEEFNEVFLDQVRIPDSSVVGLVNQGWNAARLMLMNERAALSGSPFSSPVTLAAVTALIRERGRGRDPVIWRQLAQARVGQLGLDLLAERITAQTRSGHDPGSFPSVGKVAAGRFARQLAALAMAAGGPAAVAWDPAEADGGLWTYGELFAPALSIAGGTDNIQRNIIAERVLGLPRARG